MFSTRVVHDMGRRGDSPLLARLLRESDIDWRSRLCSNVKDCYRLAFSVLRKDSMRSAYVFKQAVARELFLARHSLSNATMLTEFRVGESKCDLAILNCTAAAYEIKSERDNLDRLSTQL